MTLAIAVPSRTVRTISFGILAFLVALIAGCSLHPSEGDGELAILDRIKTQSEGRIKLISFHKTDGQKRELQGAQFYNLEFQAEIEFMEDCKWVTGMYGSSPGFRTIEVAAQQNKGFSWDTWVDNTRNPGVMVKKGHQEKLSGSIMFEKTEQGWRATQIKISVDKT